MGFVKFLEGIGDRLGILEAVCRSDTTEPARIQTRIVTLRELASEINAGEVRDLADSPAELAIPFETIFETAGISSNPADWTIDKLKQVVTSEPLKSKPREEIQRAVLDLLNAEGIPVERIVKDAMARDQALDSFENCVRQKMQDRRGTRNKKLLEIESQIKDLQEECAGLREKLETDEERWREWRKQKRTRERELASIASYIVDHPVITTDDEDAESP